MQLSSLPKILILESQLIIAAEVSLQLLKMGFDVIGINTRSEDALKTIESNRPDIIMMNIELGSVTGGIKTARRIRDTFHIPIVFLSAHTERDILQKVVKVRPYALITKPFDAQDLYRALKTTLGRMIAEELWPPPHSVIDI